MTVVRIFACLALMAGVALASDPWPRHTIDDSSRGADGVRLLDFNGDGLVDIVTGWEEGGVTRLCLHPGHEKARFRWPAVNVGRTPDVEDATPVDLDGDGAVDVVSCCEGDTKTVFVHWGPKDRDRILDPEAWVSEPMPESKERMMWMFCVPMQVDGKHGVDLVAAGKGGRAAVGWFEAPEEPRNLADWRWHAMDSVGWTMSIELRDMDGDSDSDVLLSDRKKSQRGVRWLENPGPGPEQTGPWKNHDLGGRDREVMFLAVGDLDGDGAEDIVCAAADGPILFLHRNDVDRSWTPYDIAMPGGFGTGKGVAVGDLDQNGRAELLFSCERADGSLSGLGRLVFAGFPQGPSYTLDNVSGPEGIKYDRLELVDVDGDGDLDLCGCEEQQPVDGRPGGLGVFWYENRLGTSW
ncbi:MAG: VCBS repeat-containing protein [Planctomycetaceae bacterium]|nr:VCBS repeat-containing protein [Planctomycetaceae bacterium]